ncbi:MAG: hypothetical protein HYZ08_00740 [Candidatus Kerfeldbacteria bacterium]|nr:hypothetical protein [Candidatus Kerfeldbacteria bacterium]
MKYQRSFFSRYLIGAAGGVAGGLIGFTKLLEYGANNGCFAWADEIFNGRGYESCGTLGFIIGTIGGTLLILIITAALMITDDRYRSIARWCGILLALGVVVGVILSIINAFVNNGPTDFLELFTYVSAIVFLAILMTVPSAIVSGGISFFRKLQIDHKHEAKVNKK